MSTLASLSGQGPLVKTGRKSWKTGGVSRIFCFRFPVSGTLSIWDFKISLNLSLSLSPGYRVNAHFQIHWWISCKSGHLLRCQTWKTILRYFQVNKGRMNFDSGFRCIWIHPAAGTMLQVRGRGGCLLENHSLPLLRNKIPGDPRWLSLAASCIVGRATAGPMRVYSWLTPTPKHRVTRLLIGPRSCLVEMSLGAFCPELFNIGVPFT